MSLEQYRPSRFNLMPSVTKNIIIINAIMYFASVMLLQRGIDLSDILGLHYFQSEKFHIWQFITYMFMHDTGNFSHILFNMFALWMFGAAVENLWGPKRFFNYYILTGLGAAAAHYAIVYYQLQPCIAVIDAYISNPHHSVNELQTLLNSDSFSMFLSEDLSKMKMEFIDRYNELLNSNPEEALALSTQFIVDLKREILNAPVIIGASGAVFGILAAFGMSFPNSYVYVYFAIPIKAKYFVILYGLLELYTGIARSQGDNVAHFAHLGGLIVGFIIIQVSKHNDHNHY